MKNKRFLQVILAGAFFTISLAGCGSSSDNGDDQASSSSSETETRVAADDDADDGGGSGKTLVVYYSATGTTEGIANQIAQSTDGDVFEIVPAEPYSADDLDYNDEDSRVSNEHDNPDERVMELETTEVENWDSYDTVFIGYPIWWGIAAWPTDAFIKANDFSDKTVIPFCTAASSGVGESGELLAELAGTGNWLDGEKLDSEDEVQSWLDGLDY